MVSRSPRQSVDALAETLLRTLSPVSYQELPTNLSSYLGRPQLKQSSKDLHSSANHQLTGLACR